MGRSPVQRVAKNVYNIHGQFRITTGHTAKSVKAKEEGAEGVCLFVIELGFLYLVCIQLDGRMPSELWNGKDLEGSGQGQMEVLSRNLPGETGEHHGNPQPYR
jgi:hypothetical protein